MNVIKPLSCLLAITLSHTAFADVTLNIPANVDVLAINAEKPELSGGFFSTKKEAVLPNGENQIVFRYSPYFEQGDGRVNVDSKAIITTFTASNTTLDFEMPRYRNIQDAKKNIDPLDWKLIEKSGQTVTVLQDTLVKDGLQLGRDYPQEAVTYNATGGVAALGVNMKPVTLPATTAATSSLATSTPAVTQAQPAASGTEEEMLHFWYSKADAETKARFKAFINQ
ncbi:hypothetical protein BCU68_03060 [Vibrio sp. 10N.286.49.B3]|uniref:DUF2057 family protein n=1 Tax=Vibrio sp. 10N.286.49.B3 TaxID=1880855 RepID=UPI000C83F648|nr:DUF2057 family protein [Vibrio sp. 10N.286.49.B3]PMH44496.1 hypothetical protein BCU68_03060 [Vibrio sp. 10N.286.49.B3]